MKCFSMLLAESFKACLDEQADRRDVSGMGDINQADLRGFAVCHIDLPLQIASDRLGRRGKTD